ncbi:hypothetical protein LDENG_00116520 [Lucifuga dentata]|nr:hypothetical protein LDENG_00116520 [Lucifuga dentata]
MLRGQRAQGAKKEGRSLSSTAPSILTAASRSKRRARRSRGAAGTRCSNCFLDYPGYGPKRTRYGEHFNVSKTRDRGREQSSLDWPGSASTSPV